MVVKKATKAELKEAPYFTADGRRFGGNGETIDVPDDRIFTVTKKVHIDQLAYEIEQAIGEACYLAGSNPSGDPSEPFSKSNPLTLSVLTASKDSEVASKILDTINSHRPKWDWSHPAVKGG